MMLNDEDRQRLRRRLRTTQSSSACGLCGVKGLAQAVRVPDLLDMQPTQYSSWALAQIIERLRSHQPLHDRTHAAHAAAFVNLEDGSLIIREDIGRHNALDKLGGALLRRVTVPSNGVLALTSRLSVDMVQKAAALKIPIIVAPSAPSTLAVRLANVARITLIGRVRDNRYTVYTHPQRVPEQSRRPLPELHAVSPSETCEDQQPRNAKS